MTDKGHARQTNKHPLAVQTAKVLIGQCDGKPGEIMWALKDAMGDDGEAFIVLARCFSQTLGSNRT